MLSLLKRAAPDPSRERLKAAIAALDAKKAEVTAQRAHLERLELATQEFDEPVRAKAAAERALKEFRPTWAASGAKYTDTIELHRLESDVAEKTKAAELAAPNGVALRRELARAQDALQSSQIDLQGCEESIATARGVILAESKEATELLARFESAADEYRTLRAQVMGLVRVLRPAWNEGSSPVKSMEGANVVYASIERASIGAWDNTLYDTQHDRKYLDSLSAPWRARAAELLADPEC